MSCRRTRRARMSSLVEIKQNFSFIYLTIVYCILYWLAPIPNNCKHVIIFFFGAIDKFIARLAKLK